jgi:hypothetical protein
MEESNGEEEGGDDPPRIGEMEESNGEEEGRDDPLGLERWKSLMEKKKVEMTPQDWRDGRV